MSVLIKGMEMPKSCDYCRMLEGGRMDGLCHAACKWLDDGEYWTWYVYPEGDIDYSKPCNCPLVSIPPHGRLIDADALKDLYHYNTHDSDIDKAWTGNIRRSIDSAPTIIPAEEGET